jgi:hypothetical protein
MIRAFIRDFKKLFSDKRGNYTDPSELLTAGAKVAIAASLATGAAATAATLNNTTDDATTTAANNITKPVGGSGGQAQKINAVYTK